MYFITITSLFIIENENLYMYYNYNHMFTVYRQILRAGGVGVGGLQNI